jgi:hypothetical protein
LLAYGTRPGRLAHSSLGRDGQVSPKLKAKFIKQLQDPQCCIELNVRLYCKYPTRNLVVVKIRMLQQMGGYTNKGIKFVIISEKIWITEKK